MYTKILRDRFRPKNCCFLSSARRGFQKIVAYRRQKASCSISREKDRDRDNCIYMHACTCGSFIFTVIISVTRFYTASFVSSFRLSVCLLFVFLFFFVPLHAYCDIQFGSGAVAALCYGCQVRYLAIIIHMPLCSAATVVLSLIHRFSAL